MQTRSLSMLVCGLIVICNLVVVPAFSSLLLNICPAHNVLAVVVVVLSLGRALSLVSS